MNKKHPKHILTKKQMKDFERDEYILVKNVLSSREIKNMLCIIDKVWEKHHSNNSDDYLHMFDFFNKDKIFIKLFDKKNITLNSWSSRMEHLRVSFTSRY